MKPPWKRSTEQVIYLRRDEYNGLSQHEFQQLSTYNGERHRGIMHTAEWGARMAQLQRRYDRGHSR
jgi:hypothetical protein